MEWMARTWLTTWYALVLAAAAMATSGCTQSGSNGIYGCTGPETFVVYDPGAEVSAIPVCAGATTSGAAPLSDAGVAQCVALCSGASGTVPCCQSAWEPDTVLCPPACLPQ
jgi:hypothetical protein